MLNGIAELNQRVFKGLSHLARRGSAQRRHLTVPAQPEDTPQNLQASELRQGIKMLTSRRPAAVDARFRDELAPCFVIPKSEGAGLSALFKMFQDLVCNLLLFFKFCARRKPGAIFKQGLLATGCIAGNQPHIANSSFQGLTALSPVLAGINRCELPFFLP